MVQDGHFVFLDVHCDAFRMIAKNENVKYEQLEHRTLMNGSSVQQPDKI